MPAKRRSAFVVILRVITLLALSGSLGCGGSDDSGPSAPETPLAVYIDAPSSGATVLGTVALVARVEGANRSENSVSLGRASSALAPVVRFLVGNDLVGTSNGPAFEVSWDSATVPNGAHTIRAEVEDGSRSASTEVSVVVDNAGGGISVAVLPPKATVREGTNVQFSASVTGGGGGGVTWSVDGGAANGTISSVGLYTAPSSFPANSTATVRATSSANPAISGTATVSFDRGVPVISVTVTPAAVTVPAGGTATFLATVTGTTDTGVSWTVVGGAANGTIDGSGVYTAPGTVPNPPRVTVRATSLVDGTRSGEAEVTVTAGGPLPETEIELLGATFRAGWTVQDAIREANDVMAQAVFAANELFGTLTQVGDEFQYSDQPIDRLRVIFSNGETVEMVISEFQGDTSGGFEDFLRAHTVAYRFAASSFVAEIASRRLPVDSIEREVAQTIDGTVTFEGQTWTIQGQVQGTEIFIFSESSTTTRDTYAIRGTATAANLRIEIAHDWEFRDEFFSNSGNVFTSRTDTIGSGGTDGTVTLVFDDVVYGWSDTEDRAPIYSAKGLVGRNGALLGNLVTDSASGQVGIQLTSGTIVPF